ncbi:GntR family transcriptional regulator [Chthonobacter albigriseus]|uniref:GntR family transcriptional regulator n=1 Tax=Chthonobacter albigriseus TaxID=1683161 RepID=UPI0015EF6558|nr:GntR family transcriptional regulator [Chthonobacter albigriseus]
MSQPEPLRALDDDHPQSRRVTVSGRVFDVVREAIVQLRFGPGNPLSEADVARQLGVSRQPVREAFIKLAEVGLVEIRPQRGTFVRMISVREVANARFIREAIEVAIVRKAATEASEPHLAVLDDIIAGQRKSAERADHAGFLRLDEAFHQALAHAADCDDAWRVLEGLKAQMDRVRYLSLPEATPIDVLIDQHAQILAGVRARAPEKAEAAMRQHLSEILLSLPRLAEKHPAFFTA